MANAIAPVGGNRFTLANKEHCQKPTIVREFQLIAQVSTESKTCDVIDKCTLHCASHKTHDTPLWTTKKHISYLGFHTTSKTIFAAHLMLMAAAAAAAAAAVVFATASATKVAAVAATAIAMVVVGSAAPPKACCRRRLLLVPIMASSSANQI